MGQERLKILLVSPKGEFLCRSQEFADFMLNSREMRTIMHFWNGIGVSLPTLAALIPEGHEITLVDENKEPIDFDEPYDLVGITAMTQQANRAYEIASRFRERGRHVAIGGIHPSVMPAEAGEKADTVFVGEGENTWPQFLQDFLHGSPRKFYDHAQFAPVDMKALPTPRYDLLAKYRYPVVYVQATRGCPHDCEFCVASNIYGKLYRHKTVEQVVREVREVRTHWKFAQIGLADDNLFVDKKYSAQLVDAFKDLNVSWFAVCDISVAEDEAFLKKLHESGCRTLLIGFESISKENLKTINRDGWKLKRLERYPELIERIQKWGIGVYGSFIIGLDEDTPDTPGEIADFVNTNHILGTQITILTPFPGSRLRQRLEKENRILHSDWSSYTVWNSVIRHERFRPGELETALLDVYRRIYDPARGQERAAYFKHICRDLVNRT